jgi:hypothetical protein
MEIENRACVPIHRHAAGGLADISAESDRWPHRRFIASGRRSHNKALD